MTQKRFAPARRRSDIRMYVRVLVSAGLALWLMSGPMVAQHRSADLFGDRVAEDRIDEAFKAFEELLTVSQSAAAPNSHWRVQLASWGDALEAWGRTSATLPTPIQDLKRCALPLLGARGLIEQADGLFLQARDSSDPMRAVELLVEHEKSQKQARDLLKQAEDGYRDARNAYLNRGGKLSLTRALVPVRERPAPLVKAGVEGPIRSVQEACRVLGEVSDLNKQVFRSPDLMESRAWTDARAKLRALFEYDPESRFHRELMKNCHCPVMTARRRLERLRQLQNMGMNPRARDARSRQNVALAIQQEKDHIQTEIRRTEECHRRLCVQPTTPISPPGERCEDVAAARTYANGFLQGFGSCLGGIFYGPIMAIGRDFKEFGEMAGALAGGDADRAAQLLAIKGERNRQEFDAFIKSLNPNIYGVSPLEAGFRDGSRLCAFGVIPGVVKAAWGKPLPPSGRVLGQSGLALERAQLSEASALKPINSPGGVGYVFERFREGNLPVNYKTIDRVPKQELTSAMENGGVLTNPSEITSIKTISATLTSYTTPGRVFSTLKRYMFELQNFSTHCRGGLTVIAGPRTRRVIEVGIPESATAQQLAEIDKAALYARDVGIEMRVFQLSGVDGW